MPQPWGPLGSGCKTPAPPDLVPPIASGYHVTDACPSTNKVGNLHLPCACGRATPTPGWYWLLSFGSSAPQAMITFCNGYSTSLTDRCCGVSDPKYFP